MNNVYIATLPRSGSTLLGMMLNNHPDIFHIGESSYWGKISPDDVMCSCGQIGCSFLHSINERLTNKESVDAIYEFCCCIDKIEEPDKVYHKLSLPSNKQLDLSEENLDRLLGLSCEGLGLITSVFRSVLESDIIVDNTKNIIIAEKLLGVGGWKVILLTRDPRGVYVSSKNAGIRKGVSRPVSMKIPVLLNFAQKALGIIDSERVLHVRYEDLCLNPELELSRICDFLGIIFSSSMISFKDDKGHTLMGNRMRYDDNTLISIDESWKTDLTPEEIYAITGCNDLVNFYASLGYYMKRKEWNNEIAKGFII